MTIFNIILALIYYTLLFPASPIEASKEGAVQIVG
jgi:hypothetical protein